jgi:8-oxo-dGTP diphosphatase
MQADEQGVREPGRRRYQAIPRTLLLITSINPDNQHPDPAKRRDLLLLKGAPTKRLWANRYNGLGGHIEAGEDILSAGQRELAEETGLTAIPLTLRGVINIDTGVDEEGPRPGVLLFVLVGETQTRVVTPTGEGTPEWIPLTQLDDYPLLDDLYAVIPLALGDGPTFYGHYAPRPDGSMSYRFTS